MNSPNFCTQPASSPQTLVPARSYEGRGEERERQRKKGGEGGAVWDKTERNPKAQKMRALQEEPLPPLFTSLGTKNFILFLSNVEIPIKDNNIFSLRFLLEFSQIVC